MRTLVNDTPKLWCEKHEDHLTVEADENGLTTYCQACELERERELEAESLTCCKCGGSAGRVLPLFAGDRDQVKCLACAAGWK